MADDRLVELFLCPLSDRRRPGWKGGWTFCKVPFNLKIIAPERTGVVSQMIGMSQDTAGMVMKRRYVDGPFGQIHVHVAPHGRPLVLLHQAIMAAGQFDAVFAPLMAAGLRPIAIDMPGFGLSHPPAGPPTIADYARCVAPVLDALMLERAAVAGHHTGAAVATEFALAHPERTQALILHGPMLLPDDERARLGERLLAKEMAFAALPGGAHLADVASLREELSQGRVPPDRITDYVVQAMQAYRQGTYWWGHAAAFAYRHEQSLPRIAVPCLLLTNTGDMTHASAQAALALRPDFAWAEIVGGGIDICDEAPEAWAAAIADFLRGVPA